MVSGVHACLIYNSTLIVAKVRRILFGIWTNHALPILSDPARSLAPVPSL